MKLFLKTRPCVIPHTKSGTLIIAKDGFPVEFFKNSPVKNFIRRILHADHIECRCCYEHRTSVITVAAPVTQGDSN
jgi:hypothetical protein